MCVREGTFEFIGKGKKIVENAKVGGVSERGRRKVEVLKKQGRF